MIGKVFIGATVIVSPGLNRSIRVMHMSRGLPLTSALHDPHLPALQFQRHGQVRRLGRLDLVDGVEDDHAFLGLDLVVLEAAARGVAAEHPHREGAPSLLPLLEERLELGRHLGQRLAAERQRPLPAGG